MEGGSLGKRGTGQITERVILLGVCGPERLAPRRGAPVAPALSPFCTASHPFPRSPGQRGDPVGGAQRKHLAGPGREAKGGQQRWGPRQEGGSQSLGSGQASCSSPPSHPHPSALLGSGKAVTAKVN